MHVVQTLTLLMIGVKQLTDILHSWCGFLHTDRTEWFTGFVFSLIRVLCSAQYTRIFTVRNLTLGELTHYSNTQRDNNDVIYYEGHELMQELTLYF